MNEHGKWISKAIKWVFKLFIYVYLIYSMWRLFWIVQYGLNSLSWHGRVWLFFSPAILAVFILNYLYKTKAWTSYILKISSISLILLAFFYLVEIGLRLANYKQSYSEVLNGISDNPFNKNLDSWFFTDIPNTNRVLSAGQEYYYERFTNNEGFSDKFWQKEKGENEVRVLALGNSFTEGAGAPWDSTYPKLLEKMLQSQFPLLHINVMNAGMSGSDPFFQYIVLKERLVKYNPDVVLFTNSHNDFVYDHMVYGGFERFSENGHIQAKVKFDYWWIPLYDFSYLFRFLTHNFFGELIISEANFIENIKNRESDYSILYKKYNELGLTYDFSVIQLFRPEKTEFQKGEYELDFSALMSQTNDYSKVVNFDLLRYYLDDLNLEPTSYHKYYWRNDGHHNSKGYLVMAQGAAKAMEPYLDKYIGSIH